MNSPDCLLCKIAAGQLRARVVVETANIIGVMNDAEPFARGHVVFFAKRHASRLTDMHDEDLGEILVVIKRVAAAMQVDDYNVLQNNGALAGQTVFHAHVHLIPKWSEREGLVYQREPQRDVDHDDVYRRLRKLKDVLSRTAV
ncbi:MAG: HIT family protein [Deltaproteobacteria bacterium]|nr:HIT family protein [Deltaproteobacteria bacterium]MBI3390388.1 HIT family protein [Deltaproteobacteria bacterium]